MARQFAGHFFVSVFASATGKNFFCVSFCHLCAIHSDSGKQMTMTEKMDLSDFFQPVDLSRIVDPETLPLSALARVFSIHSSSGNFPDLNGCQLALIGIGEDRRAVNNEGCGLAPDYVRGYLYRLFQGNYQVRLADLGTISKGHAVEDSYFALTTVVAELLKRNIVPIIIGGSNDLAYANYLAYEKLEQTINMVSVDPSFDLGTVESDLDSQSYLGRVILHQPNFLFNFSNIGYQSYFVEQSSVELMEKLNFDMHRLGQARAHMEDLEPVVRNADVLSFDVSAVRQSDAPGCGNASPNGFYGEEACQIARYAGISDKLSSFGIYELNPAFDNNKQTAHLVAQMVWYFIDGFYNRKKDFPFAEKSDYTKFRVFVKDHKHEIVFFKSSRSDRWWMEVPYPPNQRLKFERHHLVPCTYSDYELACKEEMPDRWWQTFLKLS
jgi:formiminoglutamase